MQTKYNDTISESVVIEQITMKSIKEIQEKIRQMSKPNGRLSEAESEYNQAGIAWLIWVMELNECSYNVRVQYPNDPDHRTYVYQCELWRNHSHEHIYHDLTKKDEKYIVGIKH